jgi:hypothetical protein
MKDVFVGFFFRLESRKHVGTVRVSIKTKCIFLLSFRGNEAK